MDVYGLFRPLFQGISKEMPKSLVRIDSRVGCKIILSKMSCLQTSEQLLCVCLCYKLVANTVRVICISLQSIQVQTAPQQTATAIMHAVALNWSHEDMRFKAMLQCNPFHSYMFNSQGTLLCASAAAIESGVCRTAGRWPSLHCGLFRNLLGTSTYNFTTSSNSFLHNILC